MEMTHPYILRAEATGYPTCNNSKGIYTCEECGEDIYEGDRYLETSDGIFCESCIKGMTTWELLDLLGESFSTAM